MQKFYITHMRPEYQSKIGEVDKLKEEIDSYRPFDKNLLAELKKFYRIGFTYASNALEGNSLTESESAREYIRMLRHFCVG